jgi:hypothetical protein
VTTVLNTVTAQTISSLTFSVTKKADETEATLRAILGEI